jgi:hypothetical protein
LCFTPSPSETFGCDIFPVDSPIGQNANTGVGNIVAGSGDNRRRKVQPSAISVLTNAFQSNSDIALESVVRPEHTTIQIR